LHGTNRAFFPRPTLPEVEPDVIGAVERVDVAAHRLYLRSNSGERNSVALPTMRRSLTEAANFRLRDSRRAMSVAMQIMRDTLGESYVDLVRLREAARADRGLRDETMPPPHIEMLSGTIQRVSRSDDSFELENSLNKMVSVALSEYVRDSDRERFQKLRSGDQVKIDGRFIGRDRFEMLSFLNNEDSSRL
jgi:hypothetical protein